MNGVIGSVERSGQEAKSGCLLSGHGGLARVQQPCRQWFGLELLGLVTESERADGLSRQILELYASTLAYIAAQCKVRKHFDRCLTDPGGEGQEHADLFSVARVRPRTSKGITDLLLLFFVQLRVASPSKKNCLPKREADTI